MRCAIQPLATEHRIRYSAGMRRPISNPPNPWSEAQVEWLGPPPDVALEVREIEAKSILSKNDSPDLLEPIAEPDAPEPGDGVVRANEGAPQREPTNSE